MDTEKNGFGVGIFCLQIWPTMFFVGIQPLNFRGVENPSLCSPKNPQDFETFLSGETAGVFNILMILSKVV